MHVYDGNSTAGEMLHILTGHNGTRYLSAPSDGIVSSATDMFLTFSSDTSIEDTGFEIMPIFFWDDGGE